MPKPNRLSHYETAEAHIEAAQNPDDGATFTADGGLTGEVQYELAAAQVRALLAIADELRTIRESIDSVPPSITDRDGFGPGDHLRYISDSLKTIADR